MSESPTQQLDPDAPVPPPTASYDVVSAGPTRSRFTDRVLGMRGVIAVALASLVIGGAGGAVLGRTTGGDDGGFGGRGGPGGGPGFQQRNGFPGAPGQNGGNGFGGPGSRSNNGNSHR